MEILYLDGTGLNELPDSFGKLIKLRELFLNHTKIRRFPKLGTMNHLRRCDLSDMILERIPRELVDKIIIKETDYFYIGGG